MLKQLDKAMEQAKSKSKLVSAPSMENMEFKAASIRMKQLRKDIKEGHQDTKV